MLSMCLKDCKISLSSPRPPSKYGLDKLVGLDPEYPEHPTLVFFCA
jgi:hypothetical protein